jgi:hypothetical protein
MPEFDQLPGEFCSQLLATLLEQAGDDEDPAIARERLKARICALVDQHGLSLPLRESNPVNGGQFPHRGDGAAPALHTADLRKLNALLPWSSYNWLGPGRGMLGSCYNSAKRQGGQPIPDGRVTALHELLDLRGRTVLEAGCFEGHHSISLAACQARVLAFDSRIENIVKALTRAWYFGYEQSIRFDQLNLEEERMAQRYAPLLERTEHDDGLFLFHSRGVLYHLRDPIAHLLDAADLRPHHIYLHTQIASEAMATESCTSPLGSLPCFRYREKNVASSPFSGMEAYALWLTRSGLEQVLGAIGYPSIQILSHKEERNGPRLELLASRA